MLNVRADVQAIFLRLARGVDDFDDIALDLVVHVNLVKPLAQFEDVFSGQHRLDAPAGLLELGHKKGDALSILSNTRHEWMTADLASLALGGVTVGVMALVLVLRGTNIGFVSLYTISDLVLVPLSLVQGLVFWWWRTGS